MGEPGGLPSMGSHSQICLKQLSSSSSEKQNHISEKRERDREAQAPEREVTWQESLSLEGAQLDYDFFFF